MGYFIKTPWLLKKLFPSLVWDIKTDEKILYLTFDDGPHPAATTFVLDHLKKYNAKATFFCIGKNVTADLYLYKRILDEGHRVGNHTQNHLNGWKVSNTEYFGDIAEAALHIDSKLFRPPYGKITPFEIKNLKHIGWKIIMWDVLSGDFDIHVTPQQCAENVVFRSRPGSIVVFHDSEKAFNRLQYALPKVLEHFSAKGYSFQPIPLDP